ncbi:MAG: LysM peptidoglycan-binding domain-containing protein [Proteobacteria bacterium]|nr:LysM peptidoglycan-binding domain-containing protein [Pseudomonadota bacterium]
MIVGITQAPYFHQAKPSFRQVMSSFQFLTQAEAERIPIERLKVYTVGKGDTPRSISKRFYGTPDKAGEIMEFNGITDESSLRPGKKLKIKPMVKNNRGKLQGKRAGTSSPIFSGKSHMIFIF